LDEAVVEAERQPGAWKIFFLPIETVVTRDSDPFRQRINALILQIKALLPPKELSNLAVAFSGQCEFRPDWAPFRGV
jgi:hypothetical protein